MKFLSTCLALLALLGVVSCTLTTRPEIQSYESFTPLTEEERESAWTTIEKSAITAASLELNAEIKKGVVSEEARQLVSFRRPDELRVELFATGLNQLFALVIANQEGLFSYDAREQRYLSGKVTLKNTFALLSVPFLPDELMLWLCGRAFRPEGITRSKILRSPTGDELVFILSLWDGREVEFRLEKKTARLRSYSISLVSSGEQLLTSTFQYSTPEQKLPSVITFTAPYSGVSGTITHLSARLNPKFRSNRLFQLDIPPGVEVIDLDATVAEQEGKE